MGDDFVDVKLPHPEPSIPGSSKRKRTQETEDTEREYLRIYETLPCQLLNAYGIAKYHRLSDSQVWANMSEPLKTGAKYMTEYAAADPARRGVAINRWLQPVLEFCRYQKTEKAQKQNTYVMQEKVLQELHVEIERILPALEYCLAPKKVTEKKGASMLRSAGQADGIAEAAGKTP